MLPPVTVIVAEADKLALVMVTTAVPADSAVTLPLGDTTATPALLELHAIVRPNILAPVLSRRTASS